MYYKSFDLTIIWSLLRVTFYGLGIDVSVQKQLVNNKTLQKCTFGFSSYNSIQLVIVYSTVAQYSKVKALM